MLPLVLATCLTLAPVVSAAPPADAAIIQRLVDSLKDSDSDVRNYVAVAIAKYGAAAVEPLSVALKDPKPERRAGAAYTLAQIGPLAKSTMPILLDLLDDADVAVRRQAAYAISRIVVPGGNR